MWPATPPGSTHVDLGLVHEAPAVFEQARALRRDHLADHPDTLASMNNIATAYRVAGRLAEALPLLREMDHKRQQQQPVVPADVAGALVLLGRALTDLDQAADAEPFLREGLTSSGKLWHAGGQLAGQLRTRKRKRH